jgi:hypothetical protein
MNVRTTVDFHGLPAGSVIQDVKVKQQTKEYSGIWSSMAGSYKISVPIEICEDASIETETDRIIKKLKNMALSKISNSHDLDY